jgi:DNA polymerase III alpha subunit
MKRNFIIYHLHSDLSLLDSCTKYKDYIDKAVE